ncbi:1,4-alpha-glucan-branching enzyme [Parasponia andersonii]|uniref:1,4-alpha-glucan-branching enzyme n=1 Tax=Parasponia andersonii TaxID=3476 RepID=A0A2P5DXV3_PARAD|nr:1,4-alpha-glucan-branching enzyme [Parasponia andersonii]
MTASKSLLPLLLSTTLFLLTMTLRFSAVRAKEAVKAGYWPNNIQFPVSAIDSTLFTHLFYAFADLDPQTYSVTVSSANLGKFSTFTQTVQLKNPSVKTVISIGGGASDPATFASMAGNSSRRKSFIDSSINLARSYNFHGLDLDWEFPSTATDMANLGVLLTEWRIAVADESRTSGKAPLLLTAAVYYSSTYRSLNYPINSVSNSLDWLNVMSYSLFAPGWWPNMTQPPAPLYNPTSKVSGDSGITAWIQAGLAAEKIVMGIPYYGFAWTQVDPNEHGLFAPATGAAITSDGALAYSQIRVIISKNDAQTVFNSTVFSDYAYFQTTWIGYDDIKSVSTKVSYAKGKGLLGYFAWSVAYDYKWVLSKIGIVHFI